MSSFQGSTNANVSSKKDNKLMRSVKPPKTGVSSRKTKTEDDSEDKVLFSERKAKYPNREKGNYKFKNLTSESSATSVTRIVPKNNIKETNPIKVYIEIGSKAENENYKDQNIDSKSSIKSTSPMEASRDIKHSSMSTNLFKPSGQAVKLKKDENSKGTALSTRFSGHSNKRSLLTGKKMSVKQLDVNKVYLQ